MPDEAESRKEYGGYLEWRAPVCGMSVVGFREVLSEQVLLGALKRGVGRQRGS